MFDRKRLLELSIVISLVTHAGFITFIQNQCLWFQVLDQNPVAESMEKFSEDEILREAFEVSSSGEYKGPCKESMATTFSESTFKEMPPVTFSLPSVSFDEMLASHTTLLPIHFSLPTLEYLDLISDLPKDLIIPSSQRPKMMANFQPQSQPAEMPLSEVGNLTMHEAPQSGLLFPKKTGLEINMQIAKANPAIPMPSLPRLPTLAELQTINLSDSFESELTFLPKEDGSGYIFALTLIPRAELKLPKLKQNVVFLIDRSNSIQRERLQATKNAVHKAIEELDEEDRFNVIAFDMKMEKAFPTLLNCSHDAKSRGDKFINEISLGSLFTLGDLYKPLFLTIPTVVPKDELYTAILLSDGEGLSKKQSQKAFFRDWTLQNQGRVSLFAVAISGDQNLSTIDAVCSFNNGKLHTSTTNKGLKRKLQRLMKNIRNPVAKNIVLKTISKNSKVEVTAVAPNLYLDQPYVVMGTVETLDDCILFLQGTLKDRHLNIKKTLSFVNAKKGGNSLSEEWALSQAYRHYEHYIVDENPAHLVEARAILEPLNLPTIR